MFLALSEVLINLVKFIVLSQVKLVSSEANIHVSFISNIKVRLSSASIIMSSYISLIIISIRLCSTELEGVFALIITNSCSTYRQGINEFWVCKVMCWVELKKLHLVSISCQFFIKIHFRIWYLCEIHSSDWAIVNGRLIWVIADSIFRASLIWACNCSFWTLLAWARRSLNI